MCLLSSDRMLTKIKYQINVVIIQKPVGKSASFILLLKTEMKRKTKKIMKYTIPNTFKRKIITSINKEKT
jgi:hypothetical protein